LKGADEQRDGVRDNQTQINNSKLMNDDFDVKYSLLKTTLNVNYAIILL